MCTPGFSLCFPKETTSVWDLSSPAILFSQQELSCVCRGSFSFLRKTHQRTTEWLINPANLQAVSMGTSRPALHLRRWKHICTRHIYQRRIFECTLYDFNLTMSCGSSISLHWLALINLLQCQSKRSLTALLQMFQLSIFLLSPFLQYSQSVQWSGSGRPGNEKAIVMKMMEASREVHLFFSTVVSINH